MADIVPVPVLDARDEDQVVAEAIGALPAELSDRGDSNPAVVILEAAAYILGRLQYQLNQYPSSVIQKILSLIGITLNVADAATVTQTFSLTNPQATDTVIETGAEVSTSDGSIVFETTEDATIAAYTAPTGTIAFTSGSANVVGTTTAFTSDDIGKKIGLQGINGTAPLIWYTISAFTDATHVAISTSATFTASGSFYKGAISTTAPAQATTTGADTNVGAATLTTLVSSISGITSTTNGSAAQGGADAETVAEAIARASTAFAARDVAVTETDYETFALAQLGRNGRAKAKAGYSTDTVTDGYVTVAMLSPTWTSSTPVTAAERGAVMRDLQRRVHVGSTTIDIGAGIYTCTPTACVIRDPSYDAVTVVNNIAKAYNNYLAPGPYTATSDGTQEVVGGYPWGRTIYVTDLVQVVEAAEGVDRVYAINGVPAVSSEFVADLPANVTFTASSAGPHTIGSTTGLVAGQTFIIDTANNDAYLVVSLVANTSITLDRAWEGSAGGSSPTTVPYFIAQDDAMNGKWYDLPLAVSGANVGLDTDGDSQIFVVGVAS